MAILASTGSSTVFPLPSASLPPIGGKLFDGGPMASQRRETVAVDIGLIALPAAPRPATPGARRDGPDQASWPSSRIVPVVAQTLAPTRSMPRDEVRLGRLDVFSSAAFRGVESPNRGTLALLPRGSRDASRAVLPALASLAPPLVAPSGPQDRASAGDGTSKDEPEGQRSRPVVGRWTPALLGVSVSAMLTVKVASPTLASALRDLRAANRSPRKRARPPSP